MTPVKGKNVLTSEDGTKWKKSVAAFLSKMIIKNREIRHVSTEKSAEVPNTICDALLEFRWHLDEMLCQVKSVVDTICGPGSRCTPDKWGLKTFTNRHRQEV